MYARKGAPYLPVGRSFSLGRPLTQHAHTLPNGQPDPRPVPYHGGKNRVRCSQMTAGEQQLNHARPVARPLLDLVQVVLVGVVRPAHGSHHIFAVAPDHVPCIEEATLY
jgi:hypothetical protein